MTGDGDHVLPSNLRLGDNDFFSLGHLQPHPNIDAASRSPSLASQRLQGIAYTL
jgi:hypothetical protein